jgi:hypothetical protein
MAPAAEIHEKKEREKFTWSHHVNIAESAPQRLILDLDHDPRQGCS